MRILPPLAPFARIAIFAVIALLILLTDLEKEISIRYLLLGGLFADYLTWLFRTFVFFPVAFWNSAAEALTNAAFAVFVVSVTHFQFDPNEPACGFAAFAFMAVGFAKGVYYLFEFFDEAFD